MVDPTKPAAPVLTLQQRLEALLASLRANFEHNAPIAPGHITELDAIAALGRADKSSIIRHDLTKHVLISKDGGSVTVVYTAEEALDYVHSLPADVQARVHWVAAEKLLVTALATPVSDTSAATRAFADALDADRKLAPVARKAVPAKPAVGVGPPAHPGVPVNHPPNPNPTT